MEAAMSFEPADRDPTIATLTPAEATAKLQEMQDALHPPPSSTPADAQEAQLLLDKLTKDTTWGKALVNGDPAARKQFDDLTKQVAAGDVVGDALAGIDSSTTPIFNTTVDGEWPLHVVTEVPHDLQAAGLDAGAIVQAIRGGQVSVAEFRAAQALQSTLHSDPAWRTRFLAGDYQAKKDQLLLSVILSSTIAESK
jgi:hypothetical protein